ncbi:MAG: DUF5518 domain-containing protein [Acidobacteria bacterium]|nr:DUF5518 domain-containing protein [Acidobacteriota bacterium]
MIQPAVLGGLFIGILSALPIVNVANCCCLWIVGGGVLAGYLAQQDRQTPLRPGRGAAVGLLAGVVGAFVWVVAAMVIDAVIGPLQERMVAEMIRNAADMPPEVRQWLELAGDRASAPVRIAVGFVFQLLAGAVFATLGGVLAVAFFGRRGAAPQAPRVP